MENAGQTWSEIWQQPDLWQNTVDDIQQRAKTLRISFPLQHARVLLTGAGTSAYASAAIASAWPRSIAVPSTDLLLDAERYIDGIDIILSIARSGNSPESLAVVQRVHQIRPEIVHIAITCNASGALAVSPLVQPVLLDPRTNDRSLVMTSSFSNLVLAGLGFIDPVTAARSASSACSNAPEKLARINRQMQAVASRVHDRVLTLSSAPLYGWAQEASLKIIEMTAGKFPSLAETYLGLRHGPMSFVRHDTLILCLLSNDPLRRRYEIDLVRELRSKKLGHLVGITDVPEDADHFDTTIPAMLPNAPDAYRTPFEIVAPQLLGYHLSLCVGLNPDNPSPSGVIHRVVQGMRIHESESALTHLNESP